MNLNSGALTNVKYETRESRKGRFEWFQRGRVVFMSGKILIGCTSQTCVFAEESMLVNWKGAKADAKYGIDEEEKEKIGKEIMRK